MVIFLYGKDTYRSRKKLNQIIKAYGKKNPSQLSFKKYREVEDVKEIKDFTQTQSMFSETKLLVLEDFFSEPKSKKEKLVSWLESSGLFSDQDNVLVFFETSSPDKRTKLFKLLDQNARAQEFVPIEGARLKNWIQEKVASLGKISISYKALGLLIEKVGSDLWQLEKEIEKSANYALAQGKEEIEVADIRACVAGNVDTDIFATIDALASKNKAKALRLLKKHLREGEAELRLLSMFCYQFRNLIRVKSLQNQGISSYNKLRSQTRLHPFVVKKTASLASNFSLGELKVYFNELFKIDKGIKTGQIKNPSHALERFIVKVAAD